MTRNGKIPLQIGRAAIDALLLAFAILSAYALRFNFAVPGNHAALIPSVLLSTLVMELASLSAFGCHRMVWRGFSVMDVPKLVAALAAPAALSLAFRLVFTGGASAIYMPISVNLMNFALSLCALSGIRWACRISDELSQGNGGALKPVLIAGTGASSMAVAYALLHEKPATRSVVGFIGENGAATGCTLRGVPVVAAVGDGAAAKAIAGMSVDEIIVPQGAFGRDGMKSLMDFARETGAGLKIAPGYSVLLGESGGGALRGADITDILKRGPIPRDMLTGHCKFLEGRRVMVTGAGGSIGSEIARQALAAGVSSLVMVERGELALFDISRELAQSARPGVIRRFIADVADRGRMRRILSCERPEIVFHAAAYKHVPLMEENVCEAVRNNILGTLALAETCADCGVGTFILLSSDKAVEPSSAMGATKRVCELALLSRNGGGTKFAAVRFGNVLGSTGSVVPVFREQILRGGPVTVTHPDMERYFMTIPEAASLTLAAAAMADGSPGQVFVLDMGEPVKIVTLAEDMIRLAGKVPGRDISIVFTGRRPGEKLREILHSDTEAMERTANPQISRLVSGPCPAGSIDTALAELSEAAAQGDDDRARSLLMAIANERRGK